jgi:hypothetical protein
MPDAVSDVVAGDVKGLAVLGDAAHDDMGMGMAGVVVIDGQPVEIGFKVLLHRVHQLPREAAKIAQLDSVFWGHDETELMLVLGAPLQEGRAVWMSRSRP